MQAAAAALVAHDEGHAAVLLAHHGVAGGEAAEEVREVLHELGVQRAELAKDGGGGGHALHDAVVARLLLVVSARPRHLRDLDTVGLGGRARGDRGQLVVLDVEDLAAHHELDELHLVAGERAGLVREDVGHHAQLLHQVRGAHSAGHVQLLAVQLVVHGDEVGLAHVHELDGHVQRDGDEVVVQQEEHEPLLQPERQHAVAAGARGVHVGQVVEVVEAHDVDADDGHGHEHHLREEDDDDRRVQVLLDLAHLRRRVAVVHLDLRLLPRVHRYAVAPVGVGEERAAQDEVLRGQRDGLGRPLQLQRAHEVVDVLVGPLELQAAGEQLRRWRSVRDEVREAVHEQGGRLLHLEVRLAVDVRRLDVALVAVVVHRRQNQQQVHGHLSQPSHLDNVARFDILGFYFRLYRTTICSKGHHSHFSIVFELI